MGSALSPSASAGVPLHAEQAAPASKLCTFNNKSVNVIKTKCHLSWVSLSKVHFCMVKEISGFTIA